MELFGISSNISVVHCGHFFHEDCLSKWLTNGQRTCPQCRYSCDSQSIIKKLYLFESDDRSNGYLSRTQIIYDNEELLNELAKLRKELEDKISKLRTKSFIIDQKDFKIKELEVNSLFALFDKDIIEDQLKKLKEEINVKNKNLFEKDTELKKLKYEIKMLNEKNFDNEIVANEELYLKYQFIPGVLEEPVASVEIQDNEINLVLYQKNVNNGLPKRGGPKKNKRLQVEVESFAAQLISSEKKSCLRQRKK